VIYSDRHQGNDLAHAASSAPLQSDHIWAQLAADTSLFVLALRGLKGDAMPYTSLPFGYPSDAHPKNNLMRKEMLGYVVSLAGHWAAPPLIG